MATHTRWCVLFAAVLVGALATTTAAAQGSGEAGGATAGDAGFRVTAAPSAAHRQESSVAAVPPADAVMLARAEGRAGPAPRAAGTLGPSLHELRFDPAFGAVDRRETALAAAPKHSRRQGRIMAIVGGAALLAGAIIGDDAGTIIMVGGAGVGLYGLYLWQR